MEQRMLGRTGVSVSKLCLGAMMFGAWGERDHDESIRIIHATIDAGVNFIDTADVYSGGESEEIVGKALAGGKRDNVVLATKIGFPMGDDPSRRGASRRRIFRGIEDSLRRLNTDWIDLTKSTVPTPTPISMRHSGRSPISSTRGRSATSATRPSLPRRSPRRSGPPSGEGESGSGQSSRRTRSSSARSSTMCQRHGIGVIPYSPLAGGWLSGRYRKCADAQGPASGARPGARFDISDPANQRKLDAAEQLAQLAEEAGISLVEMAIAFVLRHPAITAAIIGPRTMEHLQSQLAAADVVLADHVLDRIDAINPPGVTINYLDNGWTQPALEPAGRRRFAGDG